MTEVERKLTINDVWPGQQLTWLHVPRGGYGFSWNVDAEVVKVGRSLVTIRVKKASGEMVERRVKPDSLRAKGAK